MADIQTVMRTMEAIHEVVQSHDRRISSLERDVAVQAEKHLTVAEDVKEIKDNVKWLLRIVIGAVVLALLGLVFVKGG